MQLCFNPRTHEGCDLNQDNTYNMYNVSIHAPTRGATLTRCSLILQILFQSTHPRGVRLISTVSIRLLECFNPRTHEGCDLATYGLSLCPHVSIHAPTRGATVMQGRAALMTGVSIHAPTRGATFRTVPDVTFIKFQSTHPRGVRLPITLFLCFDTIVSIHAPTRGATCVS